MPSETVLLEQLARRLGEPEWLLEQRRRALDFYSRLPFEKSSLYTRHSDTALQLGDIDPLAEPSGVTSPRSIKGNYLLFDGRRVVEASLDKKLEERGLILQDYRILKEERPQLLKEVFSERIVPPDQDKLVAFTQAFFNGGLIIDIPEGLEVKEPIRILHQVPEEPTITQIFIRAGPNSKAILLIEEFSNGRTVPLLSTLFELKLDEGSTLEFQEILNLSENSTVLTYKRALCSTDANVKWVLGYMGGALTRSKVSSELVGRGSSAEELEVLFGRGEQRFDLTSSIDHMGQYTRGNIISRGVLRDRAKTIFKGMIKIGKEAKGADSFLEEHAMLLNPEARADSIPGLEIGTNDIRASHSASVAQIDEEQIFYLRSRGLDEREAKKMIILGFLEPVIAMVGLEEAREQLRRLVVERWEG